MSYSRGKSWFDYVQLSVPIGLFVLGVYVHMINAQIEDTNAQVRDDVASVNTLLRCIDERMFKHMTNDEMHTPGALSKDEFRLYTEMRNKQWDAIKTDLGEIRSLLISRITNKEFITV